jgi:hypothetical protein
MLARNLKVRRLVVLAVAVAAVTIARPLAAAAHDPIIRHSREGSPHLGEGLSGADRSWLRERQVTQRLGEGLTGSDRSWLAETHGAAQASSPANRFNWADAGVGAATAAGLLVVAGGSAVAIRRRFSPAQ